MPRSGRVTQRHFGAVAVACVVLLIAGIVAAARTSDTGDEVVADTGRSLAVVDDGAGASTAAADDASADGEVAAPTSQLELGTAQPSLGSKSEASGSSAPPSTTRTTRVPPPAPTAPPRSSAPPPTTTLPTPAPSTTTPTTTAAPTTTRPFDSTSAETEIHTFLNRQRAQHGLPALSRLGCLDSMARDWSNRMRDAGQIFHRAVLLVDTGSYCGANQQSQVAENVGRHRSIAELNNAWWASPTHRANLLGAHWTEVGIGVTQHPTTGELFATIDFRTRS